jgi:ParB family transcriptional regulator, chromosome partitioning protein
MTRKALGRGLGALLSAEAVAPARESNSIDIKLIQRNPFQPRTKFDEKKLEELAESIRENGVIQPLILRRRGPIYELVAGERRLKAAEMVGFTEVPAVIREVSDEKLLELALIENIQREELNPIEEASAYKKLIETVGLTQEVVAKRVGRDRSYITNFLRLLRLPEDLQQLVQEGKLSTGHARTLLGTDNLQTQRQLATKIIEQQLSVRETERLVREISEPTAKGPRVPVSVSVTDPNVKAAESKLRRRFGTKVRIIQNPQTLKGKIELEFFDNQELDRLYTMLMSGETTQY